MPRIILALLALAACDLTTHGTREAVAHNPDTLGLCCYADACVQPRAEQDACDPELVECTGEAAPLSATGPLWECRESSPVTENAGTQQSS